ncbi:hypothetical protein LCGC14_0594750 [marine sediment metagenome]|uniref:Uncharacterized protein n=1 Tax=marine sediment metagenome TaxID=412755 RepID=A0A0F9RW11_9ZZZZ|nr:hypothetical protein [bacterium]
MSRYLTIERKYQTKNISPKANWIEPKKSFNWVSVTPALRNLKTSHTFGKLDKRGELNTTLEKYKNYILNLSSNWDGYGAQPINEETLKRAYSLIENILQYFRDKMIEISIPLVQPVPDGSIDINWENDSFELLINISSETDKQVNLYGEKINSPEEEIEMHIPYDLVESMIIKWLKKNL